ncbi:MAG: hypothetical protein GXP57_01605, partial [Deltaproteobacteria bacterium]|nr:hypothetical protein [Deltaproteobacteria bacterium]
MKTYENKVVPPLNEVEDLTLFLNEDFDTDDVDLFEFTNATDSPLRQLKAIVLSLDWEITDATLEELSQEISNLRELEIFHNDKVSHVYLQGLEKVGSYIRAEQAYAHPNAMKLLLTLYYDFEKIISSADITGPEITGLLKADVRKFKILQYQIAQTSKKAAPESPAVPATGPAAVAADQHESLQQLYAIVLGLDWEVTDQGLQDLSEKLDILQKRFAEDRYMLILIQGLNALRLYIAEERADAHPEAFSLVHFFYEGLRLLAENEDLDAEKRREILTERVNSLNNLKLLIVNRDKAVEPAPEEDLLPEKELPAETVTPVVETVVEDVAEDVAEEEPEAGEIIPALADTMEEDTSSAAEEIESRSAEVPEELEGKIDFFFGDEDETPKPETAGKEGTEEELIETITEDDFLPEEENIILEPAEIAPALADTTDEDAGAVKEALAEADQQPPEELEDNLELFFGEEEEFDQPAQPAAAGAVNSSMETITEADFLTEEESVKFETADITPALADATDEDAGDEKEALAEADQQPPEELEEKLEFFFGSDDKEPESAPAVEAGADKQPSEELEDNLELFFGEEEESTVLAETAGDEEETAAEEPAEAEDVTAALAQASDDEL